MTPASTAESLATQLGTLGETVGDQLAALWERAAAGQIPIGTFRDLSAELVRLGNTQAADASLAEFLAEHVRATGRVPAYLPRMRASSLDAGRLDEALRTAVETGTDAPMRLRRLGRGEVASSAHGARTDLLAVSDAAGWYRLTEPDACQLCQWWAQDGRVFPVDHGMPAHPSCLCQQVPVYRNDKG